MSRSTLELFQPEDRRAFPRSACRNCRRRKECPYSCDFAYERSLHCGALLGETAARFLTAEAQRLRAGVSRADSAADLLCAGSAAEHAVSDVLSAELRLLENLSAPIC